MPRRKPAPKQIDWRFTVKVRQAIAEGRYIISAHVKGKLSALGLSTDRFLDVVAKGVVLPRREKDETGQATDGYKHFLLGVAPSGDIIEAVLKFVLGTQWPGEELVILITAYRGKA